MASSMRRVCKFCSKKSMIWQLIKNDSIFPRSTWTATVPVRGYKHHTKPVGRELYRRRLIAGPEPDRHRSEWTNWNYDSEIYAFGKRLGEEFEGATLRTAFTHRSYVEKEAERREELGVDIDVAPLGLSDNVHLVSVGNTTMSSYIKVYLRHVYPSLFEEGISAVHDYLMSTDVLSHVAKHIGVTDLVLCQEFPVEKITLADTLKAVIGALQHDKGTEKAHLLVRDFVLPRLVETDISQLWSISNPMGLLSDILAKQGKAPPEPRLQWSSAAQTVMSLYYVGIYSDHQLLGQSPGETLSIAEEMAARNALNKLMGLADSRAPLPLGPSTDSPQLDFERVNHSVADIVAESTS